MIISLILVIGGLSSIFLIATNASYYVLIVKKCNAYQTNTSFKLDDFINLSANIAGDFLRIIVYILFAWNVICKGVLKCEHLFGIKKRSWNFLISLAYISGAIVISVSEATLSHYRDTFYAFNCDNETNLKYKSLRGLYDVHAAAKSLSYISVLAMSFCCVKIFYSSLCQWKETTKNSYKNRIITRTGTDLLSEEKLYNLYYNYVEVGKKISFEYNALRQWFLIMYLESLIFLLLNLVHIIKEIVYPEHGFDISATVMNIIIYSVAFIVPYCMAFKLNSTHQDYHKEFIDSYLGVRVEIVLDSEMHVYECLPGCKPKPLKKEEHSQVEIRFPNDEASFLLQDIKGKQAKIERGEPQANDQKVENIYKQYFKGIPKGILLTKVAEFDFVPSFIISVPLDSLVYTITIISSIVSFALSSQLSVSDY